MNSVDPSTSGAARQAAILELASASGAWHTVISDSMYPFLPRACRVRLETCDAPPRVGEVLAVWNGHEVLVHRCIGAETTPTGERLVLTRGDHVLRPDPPWPLSQVLGRVVAVRRDQWTWLPEPLLDQLSRRWNAWRRLRVWLGGRLRSLAGHPRA